MADNTLLTIDMITREAVRLFVNSNKFIQNINRQYDDQFAVVGAKIGDTLRIRLPNDYVVSNGPAASVQSTTEQQTTLTVSTQRHVDVSFTSVDKTLKLDDFSERILAPMVNNLAGNVARQIMEDSEGGICNLTANTDSAGNIITPTSETFLDAGALLDENSTPEGVRKITLTPRTQARTVNQLAGLFNPSQSISQQYREGQMKNALGFDWFMDQTTLNHTTGSFTSGTVAGADQTGTTLLTNAIVGSLNKGDIITIEGVNAVNRVTKQSTGMARQFVVTAAAVSGSTQLSIYPAITPPVGGADVQYQTVTASPGAGANIYLGTPASGTYRRNFAYARDAVTMVTADLWMPEKGVLEASRRQYDGVSMRMVSQYAIGTDQAITRLDVLFGSKWVRPEWAVVVADKV